MHYKLPRAITFDPTIGFWKSIPFSETRNQDLYRGVQIDPFLGLLRPWPSKGCLLEKRTGAINSPRHLFRPIMTTFSWILLLAQLLYSFFSLFQTPKNTQKNTQKTHQSFLIFLSSPKTQGIVLIPNLLFLGSTLWIWGLGVWMQFFQLSSTPLTF